MILAWPLLLMVAVVLAKRADGPPRTTGWAGFLLWTVAGALFTFSLLTGFSIGLFLLPAAVLVVVTAARWAPRWIEAIGLVEGAGLTLLLIAAIQDWAAGWLVPGLAACSAAAGTFAVLRVLRRP